MASLKRKTREQVEHLHNTNKITSRHYNAYAKRWNGVDPLKYAARLVDSLSSIRNKQGEKT